MINISIEFGGIQELEYVHQILGSKIIQTIPQVDWTKDKSSEYYQKFQLVVLFNIAMADREKQHLLTINNLIKTPFNLLEKKDNEHK